MPLKQEPKSRVSTFIIWLGVIAAFQFLMLVFQQMANSLDFLGINDMGSIKTALKFFSGDILRLLGFSWWINFLSLFILTIPFIKYFSHYRASTGKLRHFKLFGVLLATYSLFVLSAVVRIPTLFAETLYRDGSGVIAKIVELICTPYGPYVLPLLFAVLLYSCIRKTSTKYQVLSAGYYLLLLVVFASAEMATLKQKLPDGSIVILVSDSFRSDYYNANDTPELWKVSQKLSPTLIPQVIPPVARTAPAVTSLLTGKYPGISGVTTMFSTEETWGQDPSIANYLGVKNYCTIAIAEYPGEMLRKYRYGFEFISAPRVRFKELTLQTFLKKDPFALSLMVHRFSQQQIETDIRDLVRGLPIYANANHVKIELRNYLKKCGDRPVFAFIFADQPHFPYVQTWPHYLKLGQEYSGRYKYSKDVLSAPKGQVEKDRIKELYANSLLAVESVFAEMIEEFAANGSLEKSTVFVTGDHGESLYDELDIMGHGDQIGELTGYSVPWITFGKGKESFVQKSPLPMVALPGMIMKMYDFPHLMPGHQWPEIEYYIETGVWMAETPNLPRERVRYPELAGLLTIRKKEGHVELMPHLKKTVEYSKHRLFKLKDATYSIIPLADRVIIRRNDEEISAAELPEVVTKFLKENYGSLAYLWLK